MRGSLGVAEAQDWILVPFLGCLGSFGRFIKHSCGAQMGLVFIEYTQAIDFSLYNSLIVSVLKHALSIQTRTSDLHHP